MKKDFGAFLLGKCISVDAPPEEACIVLRGPHAVAKKAPQNTVIAKGNNHKFAGIRGKT